MFKTIVIYLMLMVSTTCYSDPSPAKACDEALAKCQELVTAQDLSITHLKANVTSLQTALAESKSREPIMPTWMLITTSVLAGVVTGMLLAK